MAISFAKASHPLNLFAFVHSVLYIHYSILFSQYILFTKSKGEKKHCHLISFARFTFDSVLCPGLAAITRFKYRTRRF